MAANRHVVTAPGRREEFRGKQCYVYMVLPNATRFTTVGHFKVEMNWEGMRRGSFIYCRDYLDNPDAVPIDPFELDRLNDTANRSTMSTGMFYAFRDARSPGFGKMAICSTASMKSRGTIDNILLSPDDGAGALGFGSRSEPPVPKRIFYGVQDLERFAALSGKFASNQSPPSRDNLVQNSNSARIRDLLPFRTSIGGRKPKMVIEDAEGLWVAKNYRQGNRAQVEHAMLELAKYCGIRSAHSRLETVDGHEILLVKRFDREKTDHGYLRYRMIGGFTSLRIEFTEFKYNEGKDWNYALLAEILQRVSSQPVEDSKELFTRMVFNALINNIDDNPGNFAMIARCAEWNLSPAYDLMPFARRDMINSKQRRLSMICGIHGRQANATNLLSDCGRFCLGKEEAVAIIDAMEEQVRNSWHKFARRAGMSETDCKMFSHAFCHPGFRNVPEGMALS